LGLLEALRKLWSQQPKDLAPGGKSARPELCTAGNSRQREERELRREGKQMEEQDNLVIGVRKVSVVRDRVDLSHGDPSTSGGGDGHGDSGGDGLNIPE
jgi:hypothetical protein